MNESFTNTLRLYRCLMLALLLAMTASASAQTPIPTPIPTPSPTPAPSLEREFLKNILRDQRAIFTSPFHLRGQDARYLVPLGAGVAALIATDRRTAGTLGNGKDRLEVSRGVSEAGAFYTAGGVASAVYLVGRGTNNPRMRETGLLGAEALIDGAIVSTALKAITQRPRPGEDDGRGRFFTGGNSFPSGHAITSWSLATVIAYEYHDKPLIKYGAYGVATAVSLSRFTGRNHFLSDALVGSAIGYGIGRYVYQTHHDPELNGDPMQVRSKSKLFPLIAPQYDRCSRTRGMLLVWNF